MINLGEEIETLSLLNNPEFLISFFGLILAVFIVVIGFILAYEIGVIGDDEQ